MDNPFLLDFYDLVKRADKIKKEKWGDKVFFVQNLHLNYTNICASHCKFCAFAKNVGDDGAYDMSVESAIEYIDKNGKEANEIHIVGGLHPKLPFSYYTNLLSSIKSSFPNKVIKSFSAVEIAYFSKIAKLSIQEVLQELKKAGLEMMPGGGAEIFSPKVRKQICPEKISGEKWLDIHRTAHKLGIPTNATMLYGHLENDEDKFNHLLALRKLQDETGGFSAFISLSFQPESTFLQDNFKATGIEDIKAVASSRIVLDNIPHIKAYWVMMGSKTAQIALRAGADDLDGTIVKENISYAAGGKTEDAMTIESLVHLVKSAGLTPIERDSFYKEIKTYA